MIYLAMSRLMRRRLARQAPYGVPSPQRLGRRGPARAFQTASTEFCITYGVMPRRPLSPVFSPVGERREVRGGVQLPFYLRKAQYKRGVLIEQRQDSISTLGGQTQDHPCGPDVPIGV
jgi:hypothetical protein